MSLQKKFLFEVMITILFVGQSSAHKYNFVFENDDLFSTCPNQPTNVLNVHGLLDDSELTITNDITLSENTYNVSGNITFIWNIEPNDRIQVNYQLYRFDRGTWLPTVFSISVFSLCPDLYNKEQYWYKFWTKHVTNMEVRDKCMQRGTKMVYESFSLDMVYETTGLPVSGRHKIVVKYRAFDARNRERETSICFELVGELIRL